MTTTCRYAEKRHSTCAFKVVLGHLAVENQLVVLGLQVCDLNLKGDFLEVKHNPDDYILEGTLLRCGVFLGGWRSLCRVGGC